MARICLTTSNFPTVWDFIQILCTQLPNAIFNFYNNIFGTKSFVCFRVYIPYCNSMISCDAAYFFCIFCIFCCFLFCHFFASLFCCFFFCHFFASLFCCFFFCQCVFIDYWCESLIFYCVLSAGFNSCIHRCSCYAYCACENYRGAETNHEKFSYYFVFHSFFFLHL